MSAARHVAGERLRKASARFNAYRGDFHRRLATAAQLTEFVRRQAAYRRAINQYIKAVNAADQGEHP